MVETDSAKFRSLPTTLQHILPTELKRIRHYGLLVNPNGDKLTQACVAKVNIHQCLACGQGRLAVVQTLARPKRLPDPWADVHRPKPPANSRTPP